MSGLLRYHFVILAALLLGTCFLPTIGDKYLRVIECRFSLLARRRVLAIVMLIVGVIIVRLALLPLVPIPQPNIHDEFSYLLAGDTFAHARLTNPTPSMWPYLETFHVLVQPSYASIYPPAQGSVLGMGEMLGNPWFGVLISSALMCGAILWALQGWVSPGWAFLGGLLVALRIGIVGDWVNSYWGGAVAATGGALVIGALPRILRSQRTRDSLALGLGTIVLANSRPLEGLIFCVPVIAALAWALYRKREKTKSVVRVLVPLAVTSLCLLGFIGYYNWRVTHRPLTFPEALDSQVYTNYPMLLWQKFKPPLQYLNPQFDRFYKVVTPAASPRSVGWSLLAKSHKIWLFFVGTVLSIPLICIPNLVQDRRVRLLLLQFLLSFSCAVPIAWFFPHYFAPMTATIFVLLIQLMRHMRLWEPGKRPLGLYLTRLIVVLSVARPGVVVAYQMQNPIQDWRYSRAEIAARLENEPRPQLVLVGYHADHRPEREWVYNSADIDNAPVVWARIIPGCDMSPLLDYFKDREIWIVDADAHPASLKPYSESELTRIVALSSWPQKSPTQSSQVGK